MFVPWGIDSSHEGQRRHLLRPCKFDEDAKLCQASDVTYHGLWTPVRKSPSLHAKNQLPLPNFYVWSKHILSATSAQIFRFL